MQGHHDAHDPFSLGYCVEGGRGDVFFTAADCMEAAAKETESWDCWIPLRLCEVMG